MKTDTNVSIFVSDISANMDEEKALKLSRTFWYLDNWVQRFIETQVKYIVHDHHAQEVDQEKFYKYKSGGGTQISSAFHLVDDIVEKAFPLDSGIFMCFI